MKHAFTHWRTTLAGFGSIVFGIALIAKGNIGEGCAAVTTGIGLIASSDASEIEK